jgi:glycosyltransferase involved in cell wall biosynthesis
MQAELHKAAQEWTEKELALNKEQAERERANHEQLSAMQAELHKAAQEWTEKELALSKEHAERERALFERLASMQDKLREVDLEWNKKYATQVRLAEQEKAGMQQEVAKFQQQIQDSGREKAQLTQTHSDFARLAAQEKGSLQQDLAKLQQQLQDSNQEKVQLVQAHSEKELALSKEHAEREHTLQDQINAARQLAAHLELIQNALQLEIDTVKSSLAWRITAPLRKLGQWCLPSKPDKAASAQQDRTTGSANTDTVDTKAATNSHHRTDKNLEETSMTINSIAPANHPYASISSLEDLLDYHDEAFVFAAYRTLLLRDPDTDGLSYYLKRLRRGIDKLDILDQLCSSDEARRLAVKVPGLEDALSRSKWLKLPIIGAMLRRQGATNSLENKLALLIEVNRERFDQMHNEIASLSKLIVHQSQTAAGAAAIQRFGYTSFDSWQAVEKALSLDGRSFLEYLFMLALGRHPLTHEIEHFLAMLEKGESKLHIIEAVFSSAECKTWLTQNRIADAQGEANDFSNGFTNSFDDRSFLEYLFMLALGRHPLTHEIDHFLAMLEKGGSKLHTIEAVFSSAECKTWLAQERTADVQRGVSDFTKDHTKQRVLVVDQCIPTPDKDAGSVTAWFFLKALIELNYDVTFIPDNLQSLGRYTDNLRALGVRCFTSNEIKSVEEFLARSGDQLDFVLLYRVHTARLNLPLVKKYAPQAKIVFDTVDLHYLREERQANLSKEEAQIKAAQYTKHAEFEMMRAADATIVLSRAEQKVVKNEDPSINVFNIPLLLDIPGCNMPFAKRRNIVFIGGFLHQPNIDAIKYFVNEIWPMVRTKLPDANLLVIGSNVPSDIRALGEHDNRIEIIGYVESLDSYFNQCRLSIAPLRYGSGIKGKIGTSASYGVPCVATTLAAEGMGLVDGVEILVADGAKQFAEKLVHLYNNEKLWNQISKGSLDFVQRNYSYETGKAHLQQLFNSLTVNS